VPAAQRLLLARGQQQRVVDPRAEAEHRGQRGREPRDVGRRGQPDEGREAEADPGEGGAERVAPGAQVAQDGDQQHDRDHQADHLADRADALERDLGERLPAELAATSLLAGLRIVEDTAAARMEAACELSQAEIESLLDNAVRFAEAGIAALAQVS
jgi:hypothetical protein